MTADILTIKLPFENIFSAQQGLDTGNLFAEKSTILLSGVELGAHQDLSYTSKDLGWIS
jgi:hypothetical protein